MHRRRLGVDGEHAASMILGMNAPGQTDTCQCLQVSVSAGSSACIAFTRVTRRNGTASGTFVFCSDNLRSDDLEIIRIRQLREQGGGKSLVPECYRCHVILQGQVATITSPAQRLDLHLDVLLKPDRVGDMPAI